MTRQIRHNQQGVAIIEFALILPVLMLFFMGGIEMARYVLINQKLEKANFTVADIVAQAESIQTSDLQTLMGAIVDMVQPYSFTTNGRIIITSVVQVGNPASVLPVVRWQYCGAGGTMAATSRIGVSGGNATLPAGLTLTQGDDIIISETFYQFRPMLFTQIIGTVNLRKTAFFRPRLGALSNYTSSCAG